VTSSDSKRRAERLAVTVSTTPSAHARCRCGTVCDAAHRVTFRLTPVFRDPVWRVLRQNLGRRQV